jgi:hypothetical protein
VSTYFSVFEGISGCFAVFLGEVFNIELSYAEKTPSCAWMQWLSRWFMRVVRGWPVSSELSTHFLFRVSQTTLTFRRLTGI